MPERRDRIGRRIGHNWWREYVVATYRPARHAWETAFESATHATYRYGLIGEQRRAAARGGRRDVTDFVDAVPPPTFKHFLTGLAGSRPADEGRVA